ncbi:hypothetical protein HCN44_001790 [Aphidius gifuensis]|uniref:Cationic amino acid transporter C-terminal domain-containing protein n=2 Tax=Aphidius gifuensis TaxID=684658 RepID=A0A834XI78_APHGI|nr:hypothetical protein HCN44_001790 [Aphidius gifuensis]
MGLFFTLSNALECYVCDNQEDNKHKCLQSIKTCEQDEDVCMTEVKWGSAPYWTVGAKKQYYISKKCATESHCRRIREKNMPDCTYLWYVDWKCSECCRGDRCNYFIFVRIIKVIMVKVLETFTRKKWIDLSVESGLTRCLSTLDLTALGIGSTLGVGVYVLAGSVAKVAAGPAVIISFAIAAIASIFAGLCYAEFGARVPKAGSAYVYSYVTVGEFIAFLIGWTLILEYVIGAASVVKGLSEYVDALLNHEMQNFFKSIVQFEGDHFSKYPDLFAFTITMIFSLAIAFGAKESSVVNNIFTLINLGVVLFVIGAGCIHANFKNWQLPSSCYGTNDNSDDCKNRVKGGFARFGIAGIICGAARCFYGYIGFDVVATAGEEARNPKKSIPIAIVTSLTIVFLAYFGVSSVLTLTIPYYQQNDKAPLPFMFDSIGWGWAKMLVSLGAICALCASLLGALFPLPRVIHAMASDGLIFKFMGKLHPRFQTPLIGTLTAGFLTGILSAIFELDQLVDMMSLGTLLAYSIVAACVLILRYEESEAFEKRVDRDPRTAIFIVKQLININRITMSTKLTGQISACLISIYVLLCIPATFVIARYSEDIINGSPWAITSLTLLLPCLILTLIFIYCQPVSEKQLAFTVPFVPFLPATSIFINMILMMMLKSKIWISFSIWLAVGLSIYFSYGVWHSTSRKKNNSLNDNNSCNYK